MVHLSGVILECPEGPQMVALGTPRGGSSHALGPRGLSPERHSVRVGCAPLWHQVDAGRGPGGAVLVSIENVPDRCAAMENYVPQLEMVRVPLFNECRCSSIKNHDWLAKTSSNNRWLRRIEGK